MEVRTNGCREDELMITIPTMTPIAEREDISLVYNWIAEAEAGCKQAQQLLALALREAQNALMSLLDTRGLFFENAVSHEYQSLSISSMLRANIGGSGENNQALNAWRVFVASTSIWLARAAYAWMCFGCHPSDLKPTEAIALVHYWLSQEDCEFLSQWPFTREQIAGVLESVKCVEEA